MSTTFEKILSVFKENGNHPLTTKDIYEQLESKKVNIGGKTPIYTISGEISRSNKKARLLNSTLPFCAKGKRGAVKYFINEQYFKYLENTNKSKKRRRNNRTCFSSAFNLDAYGEEELTPQTTPLVSDEELTLTHFSECIPHSPPPTSPSTASISWCQRHHSHSSLECHRLSQSPESSAFIDIELLPAEEEFVPMLDAGKQHLGVKRRCVSQELISSATTGTQAIGNRRAIKKPRSVKNLQRSTSAITPFKSSSTHCKVMFSDTILPQVILTQMDDGDCKIRRMLDLTYLCENNSYEFVVLWKDGSISNMALEEAKKKYPKKVNE